MPSDIRVVVTGMGLISPIGTGLDEVTDALRSGFSGVVGMPDWGAVDGLRARVAAPARREPNVQCIPRRIRRGMGRQALLAGVAAQAAVAESGLSPDELAGGRVGVSIGSTLGSPASMYAFYKEVIGEQSIARVRATSFLQFMGHTCAANVAAPSRAESRFARKATPPIGRNVASLPGGW